jgi:hypothetical protein
MLANRSGWRARGAAGVRLDRMLSASARLAGGSRYRGTTNDSWLARETKKETDVIKKNSRLQINDITRTKQRLGQRELSAASLKLVSAGVACQGGTCTLCDDCDE